MDIKQEFNCNVNNSTENNIPDMFKYYNELYTTMIHAFDNGTGIDLRRNNYK